MADFEITETTKGKPSVTLNGYQYRKHRTNKNDTVSWLCIKERTEKCRGRLKTKEREVLSVSEHICKANVAEIEVNKHFASMKKRLREEQDTVKNIYKEEIIPLFNRGYEFVTEIPLFSAIEPNLHRIRRRHQGTSIEPIQASEVQLPQAILQLQDGGSFLLTDKSAESERIFVFASTVGKDVLKSFADFFIDGTFKSCSKQFTQLYTIHADIGSTNNETNIIPVAYALLKNKSRATYENLFNILKNVANWNPKNISMDFEQAAIIAIQNIFPSITINGCNFHFNQCIWRKVQELGLVIDYKNNEEIRLFIRMCAALTYLPVDDVEAGWLYIQELTPNHQKLTEFYDYFVDQWLDNPHIKLNDWNCHEKRHRTNNAVEGWNNKLNAAIKKRTPKILDLVTALKEDAEYAEIIYRKKELNLECKRRKKVYITLDDHIKKTMQDYKCSKDIGKCLRTLAYITKLQ